MCIRDRCEIAADTDAWQEMDDLIALARAEAHRCGLESLPSWADRLQGMQALHGGRAEEAVRLLTRASAGFQRLEARWDLARSDLALARALEESGRVDEALAVLGRADAFFAKQGAKQEHQVALQLAARIAGPS